MSEPTWELLGGGGVVGGPIDYVGAWAAGTTYQPGQVVRYGGIDYLAVNVSLGQVPPSAAPFGSGVGTSLPASPFDGQEYTLVDSLTAPTYAWRFRYTASITDAYKWVFVGGAPLRAERLTLETTPTSGSYSDLGGLSNPQIVLPRPGNYEVNAGARMYHSAANCSLFLGVYSYTNLALVFPQAADMQSGATSWVNLVLAARLTAQNATNIKLMYMYNVAGTGYGQDRWMTALPVRVS